MQILILWVETLGIFHVRLYVRAFTSNPALLSKINSFFLLLYSPRPFGA